MNTLWRSFGLRPRRLDEDGVRYADMYARGVAAGIDLLILMLLLEDFFHAISMRIYAHIDRAAMAEAQQGATAGEMLQQMWHAHMPQLWFLNSAFQIGVIGVLMLGCQCLWYTTPGKYLMGLRVVKAGSFERPSRLQFVIRFFAYIPATLSFMIGFIWMSFNKQRRGWHDYVAGTVVIHTRPRDWIWVQIKRGYRALRKRPAA